MALTAAEKARLKRAGLSSLNKPKRTARRSFKARHRKNIAKGKSSAAWWANKVFWAGKGGSTKRPPRSQKHVKGIKRRR